LVEEEVRGGGGLRQIFKLLTYYHTDGTIYPELQSPLLIATVAKFEPNNHQIMPVITTLRSLKKPIVLPPKVLEYVNEKTPNDVEIFKSRRTWFKRHCGQRLYIVTMNDDPRVTSMHKVCSICGHGDSYKAVDIA
jgi:hypothetical protein